MEHKYKIYELPFNVENEMIFKVFTIHYYLIEHYSEDINHCNKVTYGIMLEKKFDNSRFVEICYVPSISSTRKKVLDIIELIYINSVTTIGLHDVIYELI